MQAGVAEMIRELCPWFVLGGFTLLAFYFLVGYPLLLKLVPSKGLPVHKDPNHEPTVSVLLAVHNGEAFIDDKLNSLLGLDYPVAKLQILVLGDGCNDGTAAKVEKYAGRGVHYVGLQRGGKAMALNAGMEQAQGEILFFTDVRQKLDRRALRELVANFADPTVGAVTGELKILKRGGAAGEQEDMDLYWRYELWVRRWHSAEYSLFNTTGCLYAMRRQLCSRLRPDTLIDDAELPLQAYRAGYRIVFDNQSIAYDYPTQAGGEWRRRMRTLGGMWQIFVWHPELLWKPHRMWLHFVSHKLGRLLLPWILLGIILATALLPQCETKWFLTANELVLVGLAVCSNMLSRVPVVGRSASWARTFLMMNLAALFSLKVFFVNPQQMWGTTKVDRQG